MGGIDSWLESGEYPTPKVAALAVLTVLGFGVLLGSVVGGAAATPPIYLMQPAAPATVADVPLSDPTTAPIAPMAEPIAETAAVVEEAAPTQPVSSSGGKINHVWLIVLSGQGYGSTFGNPQSQSFLKTDLAPKGEVVQNHFAVAQGQLANSVALVSGQCPSWQITQNCPVYSDLAPGTIDLTAGQALGDGCIFPETVKTISDAVTATGRSAFAYVEDIDNGANGSASSCRHPQPGALDPDHSTDASNAYASWSNPFVYFKTVTSGANCAFQMGGLKSLDSDLAASRSPAFSLVVPNSCHDGSEIPCSPGGATGLAKTDDFLRNTVVKIMSSKDYLDGGVIAVTFDNAPNGGPRADVSSCCGQPQFPNLMSPPAGAATGSTAETPATENAGATGQTGATGPTGPMADNGPTGSSGATTQVSGIAEALAPSYVFKTELGENAGGGKVGLLLLSPMIKEASTYIGEDSNHFSLLLSIENWLGTEKLGYTNDPSVAPLADSVFNKSAASGG